MANHSASKKSIRQSEKNRDANRQRVSRIRTFMKKVDAAIGSKDKSEAEKAFKIAMPEMMRGTSKGVMHAKTVARKLSRFSAKIKALA